MIDEGVLEEHKTFLEENDINIKFAFKDGSKKVVMDSISYALEYRAEYPLEIPSEALIQETMAPSTILSASCEASYSSSWYGTAKSKTIFERDTVAQKVRTYSNWVSLTQTANWPWSSQGGLYYMIPTGSYGSWVSIIEINHAVYWKMQIWPNSWYTKVLNYEMSWAACLVH